MLSDQRGRVGKQQSRVILGQGQTTFFKNTCTKRAPSEPWDPGWKTTKPLYAAAGFVFGSAMISRVIPSLSVVTWCRSNGAWHWTSQDWNVYLWQEVQLGKTCLLSRALLTPTHRLTQIHTLALYLWWFKPKGGIYDRWAQKNRVV